MARNKISTTVYITQQQDADLKALHVFSKVPVSCYIREGIDLVLAKNLKQMEQSRKAGGTVDGVLPVESERRPGRPKESMNPDSVKVTLYFPVDLSHQLRMYCVERLQLEPHRTTMSDVVNQAVADGLVKKYVVREESIGSLAGVKMTIHLDAKVNFELRSFILKRSSKRSLTDWVVTMLEQFLKDKLGSDKTSKSGKEVEETDMCPHSFSPCSCDTGVINYKGK